MSSDTETHWVRSAPLNCTKLKQETEGCVEIRIYMNCYCYHLSPMYISHTRATLPAEKYQAIKGNLCPHLSLEKRAKRHPVIHAGN